MIILAVEHIQETDTLNRGREKINQAIDLANDSSTKVDQYGTELDQGIKDAKKIATDAGQAAKTTADTAAAEAKQTASTAATEATNIATVAGQEAKNIAETAGAEANKKADQAVADSKTAVESSNQAVGRANQNKQEFDALRNEFDDLVAESGDSNPEIVQARTDSQGVKQNTLQNRLLADFSTRLTNADAIQLFSGPVVVPLMMDFSGKVAGNTAANPHSYYTDYTSTSLKKPTDPWNEITQENYNKLAGRDDQGVTVGSSQGSVIPQNRGSYNTIVSIEQLAPRIFEGMSLSEKVKYIKDNFISFSITTRAKATSPNNKNLKVGVFLESTGSYTTKIQGDATDFTDFTVEITDSNFIDSKGFIEINSHTDSSNGVTASSVTTDYVGVQLKVSLNPLSVLNKAGFANEADLALKADLEEFQEYVARNDNPHNVTAEQVGAYSEEEVDKNFTNKSDAEATYAKKTDLTKEKVGLGKVDNYTTATQPEAEAAISEERFMVPKTTRNLVDRNFGQPFTSGTKFIAHRGNSYFYPENSLVAFEKTTRHWGAETDIQLSTDGKWYCFHDKAVDRMTNGTGNFMDKTSSQIDALRLDTGNGISTLSDAEKKIPTFDQYLNACLKARIVPVIEITPLKTDFTDTQLDSIVTTIRRKGLENKCVIICFTYDVLVKMRKRMPSTVMHWLLSDYTSDVLEKCIENHFVPSFESTKSFVTQSLVDQYHDSGLDVGIWVVPYSDHQKYAEMGLDYISTNDPSGNLRYFEPALRSGMQPNNVNLGGPTYMEETSNGEIHIRVNVTAGQNDVGVYICALESWAIPRHSLNLIGYVRATKITGFTFVPVSVGVGGYSANDSSIADANIKFGYLTTGTNWEQRATYAAFDLFYRI
nr:MAG TPA: Minor structural protein [Caudoviricetes sp.]